MAKAHPYRRHHRGFIARLRARIGRWWCQRHHDWDVIESRTVGWIDYRCAQCGRRWYKRDRAAELDEIERQQRAERHQAPLEGIRGRAQGPESES